MAVNKNFVVKNGLEVDTNTLFVDSANNRVAIGTTVPTVELDVRGKIKSDSEIETWNARIIGIATVGAVGVTTLTATDATITGFSTLGYANASSLKVTTGFTTVQSLSAVDLTVSIGATISKDLQVGAALTVTGISTFTGSAKFAEFVRFEKDITVGSAATVGVLTVTGGTYIGGNLTVGGDINLDEITARNLNISGIATLSSLHVGIAGTILSAIGVGNSQRVGIGTVPVYVLDVLGDINTSTNLRVGGVNISEIYATSGDATALAIALG